MKHLCDSVCGSSLAFAWAIPKAQMSPLSSLPLLFTVIYFECLFLLLFFYHSSLTFM